MKNNSNIRFIFLTALLFLALVSWGQKPAAKTNEKEDEIVKSVWSLQEVIDRDNFVRKQTSGVRNLKVWIYKTPNQVKDKYYWIKVSEDNGGVYVSHFNFFVYPDNLLIRYFDTIKEEEIDLDEWRKKK